MILNEFKKKIKIIPENEAQKLRKQYIDTFIDTEKDYFKKYIQERHNYSDGSCYTGYLWDCLKNFFVIDFKYIQEITYKSNEVFVFWDIHTKERILITDYWKFRKEAVLRLDFETLIMNLEYLPEDIYIFDESMTWTLILTHEYFNDKRWCLKCNI